MEAHKAMKTMRHYDTTGAATVTNDNVGHFASGTVPVQNIRPLMDEFEAEGHDVQIKSYDEERRTVFFVGEIEGAN